MEHFYLLSEFLENCLKLIIYKILKKNSVIISNSKILFVPRRTFLKNRNSWAGQ